jgi:putative inorganic carbon (hco3(-)) transporter
VRAFSRLELLLHAESTHGMPRTLIARPDAHAWTFAVFVAVALGYTAARIAGSPGSTSSAILLLALLMATILVIVHGLKRVLLAAAILGIPFQSDKNYFYDFAASAHGAIGGISLSVTTIALFGLYALWVAELLLSSSQTHRPRFRWALPAFAYIAVMGISSVVAANSALVLNELALVGQTILLFIYVSSTVRSLEQIRFVIRLLLLALTVQASLLAVQYFTGASIQFAGLRSSERIQETTRVAGTLGSPNSAGGFLAACIAIAVALVVARGAHSFRVLPIAGICIGGLALVLTFSRGGWLAATISIAFVLAVLVIRGALTGRILVVGVVVAVLGLSLGGQIHSRLQSQSGGLKARAAVGDVAVDVIRDHPLTGVGANNYVTVLPEYTPLTQWAFIPHNKFLLVWSETGIAGLAAFIAFLAATAGRGWLALRDATDSLIPYATALNAAFIALLVQMNLEPFHGRLDLMLLFLLAGLIYAAAHVASETRRRAQSPIPAPYEGDAMLVVDERTAERPNAAVDGSRERRR